MVCDLSDMEINNDGQVDLRISISNIYVVSHFSGLYSKCCSLNTKSYRFKICS